MENCFFCESKVPNFDQKYDEQNSRMYYEYVCPRCKNVFVTALAIEGRFKPHLYSQKYKISSFLRNQYENGQQISEVSEDNIDFIVNEFIEKNVTDKIDQLLLYISQKSNYIGNRVAINYMNDYPILGCKIFNEFFYLLDYLKKNELIIKESGNGNYVENIQLTVKGWNRVEEIRLKNINSKQAFVAMWFDESMKSVYTKAIKPAIEQSGYFPLKIDTKEHNNKICDEIIIEIRRSKFLIADVTELRGGIYFEAGYAMGLGIPVIWTCREEKLDKVHFDTRQYNHIVWKDEKNLYEQLKNRIQATIFVI